VHNVFEHLNGSDALLGPQEEGEPLAGVVRQSAGSARRHVLSRLGDYASIIVGPLNLRPIAAALLAVDDERIEVRISTPGSHVVLAIAPDGDLAAEVFFLRALAGKNMPVPRLISYDLGRAVVPFTYTLESYAGGVPLERLEDAPLIRVAARQIGRTLRRAHQLAAPGYGRPTPTGRWPARTWSDALNGWLAGRETLAHAEEVLGTACAAALRAATLDHPALACDRPCLLHGAVEPARALVSVGDSVQLEALSRPGAIVGGDPLFDLAHGLLPRHPPAFRQGLFEGYTASGPLAPEHEQRLRRLGLLLQVADTLSRADDQALARLPGEVADELGTLGCTP
jgi:aminoglycoside phosphotransferase (APT) family kinase protein